MTKYETITLIITVLAWVVSLIIQWFILSKQNASEREITRLQNILGARRETASNLLENLSSMTNWLEEGLAMQSDILPIKSFLEFSEEGTVDPKPNRQKIITQLNDWSNASKRFVYLAQVYDPKFKKKPLEWNDKLDKEFPEDLPRLLESFQRIMYSFCWEQLTSYQDYHNPDYYSYGYIDPDEAEFRSSLIQQAEKYIVPVYQKIHFALSRVREYVVTEPLSYKD